jgi:hypothetical protein
MPSAGVPGYPAPTYGQPSAVVDPARAGLCRVSVMGGAAIVLIGSVLPWASVTTFVGTISVNGTNGDGVLTLIGALLIAGLAGPALWGLARRGLLIGALVLSALVAVVALIDIADVSSRVADANGTGLVHASVGFGLWLTLVGAIVATAGTAIALASLRRMTP